MAESPRGTRFWARFLDAASAEAGAAPVTVIRRRADGDDSHDESFRVWGGWAPSQALYDVTDPRPSTPPHLTEIDATQADRILLARFGVAHATRLPVGPPPVPEAADIQPIAEYLLRAIGVGQLAAVTLDACAAAVGARRAREFKSVKSLTALNRQVAVLNSEGVATEIALPTINDVVRFTVVLATETYVDQVQRLESGLVQRKYTMVPGSAANSWSNPGYRDYRSVWTAAGSEIRIEIQFHTAPSLAAREAAAHLHDFERQLELWPANEAHSAAFVWGEGEYTSESVDYVRASAWWTGDATVEHEDAVAALLGFDGIERGLRGPDAAPLRLAYLLDLDTGNPRVLFGLLGVLRAFVRAQPIPDELDAAVAGIVAAAAEPEYGAPVARLLCTHLLLARGVLDGHPATPSRPFVEGRSRGAIVAATLGLPDTDAMRAQPSLAAARLAILLGIPARTGEARLVLSTLLATFVEDACVPPLGKTEELVEETGRIVGIATPLEPADPALYAAAAAGFGVPGFLEDSAGIYRVCNRAAVFLFKTVLIRSL